ncbi:MAG: hypothetical protein KBT05_04385 [Bacteroidales bacterium]|nr:hypothetical protein [Candidatus Cryptobacteroides caccocaballi]
MIINSLTINYGGQEKSFHFSDKNTIIHSGENSRGKTTLLRLLLYSLGYNIPGTRRFKFANVSVKSNVVTDNGELYVLDRTSSDYLTICTGTTQQTYCLPEQIHDLHSLLFGTNNRDVLNNLLGVFYLDQEKGWTLLNRGIVIGSNRFNVEDLIQGLSGRDCSELKQIEQSLVKEMGKFQQIANVVKYKESMAESAGLLVTEKYANELDAEIAYKEIEINEIKKEINRIDKVLQSNKYLKRFIEDMNLIVQTPNGESIHVTSNNLIGLNDSIDYLIAKRKIKAAEYRNASRVLETLLHERSDRDEPELFSVESIADVFDQMVKQFPYGYARIETIINNLKDQISSTRTLISEATRVGNDVVSSLYNTIVKYAEELELGNNSSITRGYLFTSNLKELSGAILHKFVFVFRLAYISEVKKRLGITLPIILDSPSGKELDQDNKELMIRILNRDFSDHQIIIASIFDYNLESPSRIELDTMLME